MRRTMIVTIGVLIAVASVWVAGSLLLGLIAAQPGKQRFLPVSNEFARPGITLSWPVEPPNPEWPLPTQVQEDRGVAGVYFSAIAFTDAGSTHQMVVTRYGWPLPVLEHVRFAWPWKDARYATSQPPDRGLQVMWLNLFIPAIAIGTAAAGMIAVVRWATARSRAKQGRCVRCGFQLMEANACPECGLRRSILKLG